MKWGKPFGAELSPDDFNATELRKAEQECLTRPHPSAMWDERLYTSHGATLSWAERGDGDGLVAESNYARVLEDLKGIADQYPGTADSDDVIDASISDWVVGSLHQLFVRVRGESGEYTQAFLYAVAICTDLREIYPLYDESDHSEREYARYESEFHEALDQAIGNYLLEESRPGATHEEILAAFLEWAGDSDNDVLSQTFEGGDNPCSWESVERLALEFCESRYGWEAYARSLAPTQPERLFQ